MIQSLIMPPPTVNTEIIYSVQIAFGSFLFSLLTEPQIALAQHLIQFSI